MHGVISFSFSNANRSFCPYKAHIRMKRTLGLLRNRNVFLARCSTTSNEAVVWDARVDGEKGPNNAVCATCIDGRHRQCVARRRWCINLKEVTIKRSTRARTYRWPSTRFMHHHKSPTVKHWWWLQVHILWVQDNQLWKELGHAFVKTKFLRTSKSA